MALTHQRVLEVARSGKSLADKSKALLWQIEEFLNVNSAAAIDWVAGSKPAYINEDSNGNFDGLAFTRAAMANAIGSLDNMRKLLRNQDLSGAQGDHLGNLDQLADADSSK